MRADWFGYFQESRGGTHSTERTPTTSTMPYFEFERIRKVDLGESVLVEADSLSEAQEKARSGEGEINHQDEIEFETVHLDLVQGPK